jgi:hypothetical protein
VIFNFEIGIARKSHVLINRAIGTDGVFLINDGVTRDELLPSAAMNNSA